MTDNRHYRLPIFYIIGRPTHLDADLWNDTQHSS